MPVQKYVPSFIAEFVLLLYVVVQQILTTYMHVLNGHFLRNKIKILANNQIIIFRGLCLMFWVSGCVSTPLYNVLMFLLVSFFMYLVLTNFNKTMAIDDEQEVHSDSDSNSSSSSRSCSSGDQNDENRLPRDHSYLEESHPLCLPDHRVVGKDKGGPNNNTLELAVLVQFR
jgi:hypothetical protein